MLKICTIFDYKHNPPEPLFTTTYDGNEVNYYSLYHKNSNLTIKEIKNNINIISDIINNSNITILNDAISHFLVFNINPENIYETRIIQKLDNISYKKYCLTIIKEMKECQKWMNIKGRSSFVYAHLIKKGLLNGSQIAHPLYDNKTITGRSRAKVFNIQGSTKEDPIRSIDNKKYFICFDWVSADINVAGYLSGDEFIKNSFVNSDPYTEIEKILNDPNINRDDCKLEMLKSLYSLDDSPLFDLMPDLKNWINNKKDEFRDNKFLYTINGMPILSDNIRTAFNGIIQGSVAEAIQNVIYRISKINIECILTEIQDSLILVCDEEEIKNLVDMAVPILLRPFEDTNLTFPVRVNIGDRWKQWKGFKTFR